MGKWNQLAIPAMLMLQQMYDNSRFKDKTVSDLLEPLPAPPPPWVNARIDIPKSVRRGKTYEEILEIKKQIWLKAHPETEAANA